MPTQEEAFARLNIEVDLLPANARNRPRGSLQPTHITIHNTANAGAGADARMHARYMKGADAVSRKVSWHFTVDDRRCIKHLPTTETAWHAGPGNARSIGIEICEHANINRAEAEDRASLLVAVLIHSLGIAVENVVPHQHWTGKNCPHLLLHAPGGFPSFRARAAKYLEELQAAPAAMMEDPGAAIAPIGGAPDLSSLVEQLAPEPMGFGIAPEGAPVPLDGGTTQVDDTADVERLVGQLVLENYRLRKALLRAQDMVNETD